MFFVVVVAVTLAPSRNTGDATSTDGDDVGGSGDNADDNDDVEDDDATNANRNDLSDITDTCLLDAKIDDEVSVVDVDMDMDAVFDVAMSEARQVVGASGTLTMVE